MSKMRRKSGQIKAMKKKDIAFEIAFYENILESSPDFVEALTALGTLYTKKGFYDKGLETDIRLAELRPDNPYVYYNLACSYALVQDVKGALKAIETAIELGFNDIEHLQQDKDLENLLVSPEFQEYLLKLKGDVKAPASVSIRRQS